MNLYLLSQSVNNDYDTYDSCVVCADSEEEAKGIHPMEILGIKSGWDSNYPSWVKKDQLDKIEVELIGTANDTQQKGVVIASYNAG